MRNNLNDFFTFMSLTNSTAQRLNGSTAQRLNDSNKLYSLFTKLIVAIFLLTMMKPNEINAQASTCGLDIIFTQNSGTCVDGGNGILSVLATGGVPPYSFLWNTGATTTIISSVPAGTYTVTVTDNNGCAYNESFTLYTCCVPIAGNSNLLTGNFTVSAMIGNPAYPFLSTPGGVATFSNGYVGLATSNPATALILNGTLTIDMPTVFSNFELICGPYTNIIVQNNPGTYLYLDGTNGNYLHGCGQRMWQGITVQATNNAAFTSFDSKTIHPIYSFIEDAEEALLVDGEAFVKVRTMYFNKNNKGLIVKNNTTSNPEIYGNYFICLDLTTFAKTNCIAPYSTQRSSIGISGLQSVFDIGNSNNLRENCFENLDFGISTDNCNLTVKHAKFKNLDELPGFPGLGTAIYAFGKNLTPGNGNFLVVGGYGPFDFNDFFNCHNGITMISHVSCAIWNNTFNNVRIGVNKRFGINALSSAIVDNVFLNTLNYSQYDGSKAIILYNSSPATANTQINANAIENYRIGINAININDFTSAPYPSVQNTIKWNILNSNIISNHFGVLLENCPNAQLGFTYIEKTTPPPPGTNYVKVQGIKIDNSTSCYVQENKIINAASGISIYNNCASTELHCNIMDACKRGVNLNNATLPTQGTTAPLAWDNQWQNMTGAQTRVNGSTQFNIPIPWHYQGAVANTSNTYWPDNVATVVTAISGTGGSCTIMQPAPSMAHVEDDVINVVDEVSANNNVTSTESEIYTAKEFAVRELKKDTTLMDSTTAQYQERIAFLNGMANEAVGKFYKINTLVNERDFSNALNLLQTITPANTIEDNLYQTIFIFLTTYAMDKQPDQTQWETLLSIAQQTVLSGGPGVYNARAMTGWEQDDDANGARTNGDESVEATKNEIPNPKFYPNPAKNIISLNYNIAEGEQIEVIITNSIGTIVRQFIYNFNSAIILNVNDLANGIYSLQLKRNNASWFNTKLVILK